MDPCERKDILGQWGPGLVDGPRDRKARDAIERDLEGSPVKGRRRSADGVGYSRAPAAYDWGMISRLPVSRPARRARAAAALVTCSLLAAVAALTVSAAAGASSSRSSAPAPLDFSLLANPGGGDITLGQPQGAPSCSTGAGGEQTCVTAIGTSASYAISAPVRDNATGDSGTLTGSCSVMFAGTQTTYTSRPGRADATGSEDCSLTIAFGASTATGALHEQRVLVDNLETNTFALTITSGTGRYAGLTSVFSFSESNPWTASPPIGVRPGGTTTSALGIRSLALHLATPQQGQGQGQGGKRAGGGGGQPNRITLRPSAKPVADITSLGLLLPANAPAKAEVTAVAGSTCSGEISGARTVALAPVKVASAAHPTLLGAFAPGTFGAKGIWKLRVTCTDAAGRVAVVARSLRGFTVTKKG